jgi:hydrogenase nickel incorporation protein HypA/HybF
MREYAIAQELVECAEAEARARGAASVQRLSMRIGELSGVEPELLTRAYNALREATICERAKLDIFLVPARWLCPVCGSPLRRGDILNCQRCEIPAPLAEGDEVTLDRIDLVPRV